MGKKMKGVAALDLPAYGDPDDAKITFKHQNLLQDYHELERETDSTRTKLEITNQRKKSLLAEVSFLRRRYKYLSAMKSATQLEEQESMAQVSSGSRKKLSSQNRISKKNGAHLHHLPPLPNSNSRGRIYNGKEVFHGNTVATPDLNHRQTFRIGKEATHHSNSPLPAFSNKRRVNNPSKKSAISHQTPVIDLNLGKEAQQHIKAPNNKRKSNSSKKTVALNAAPVIDLNLTDRMHIGNDFALSNMAPLLDLNQDSSLSGREASTSSRAPIFDLNEVSTAEEDMQSNSAPLEELKKSLMRAGTDDQFNQDLKLPMCRNSGEGPSRVGKRKISWQDPVALRV